MRILIISFFNDWITHLGAELEIAQLHLDNGDAVEFLVCDGGIEACRANKEGDAQICEVCRYKRLRGIQLLSGRVEVHQLGDHLDPSKRAEAEQLSDGIRTAAAAKEFRFNGHDLGWGALSSAIQETRDPVCEGEEASGLLSRFTRTAVVSYRSVRNFLEKQPHFERAYIFNGRFACTRGAFRACESVQGMDTLLHERGSSTNKYTYFKNEMLHTRVAWRRRIAETWESESDSAERVRLGSQFYVERRAGTAVAWKSFTARQKEGALPEGLSSDHANIAIFNSSEDEFAGIGDEWSNHVYPMQSEGVERIVTEARERYPDLRFYLRMHPNLLGVENDDVRRLRSLRSENFVLIEPDSPVSSYALLDAVDKVISFGSSVGIEATFWGKPSIMAGRSFYEHLGSVYCADDHEHLMELIGENLPPLPKEGAIKYGFHLRTFGTEFEYWKAEGFENGSFQGRQLRRGGRRLGRRVTLFLSRYLRHDSLAMRAANLVADGYDKLRRLLGS